MKQIVKMRQAICLPSPVMADIRALSALQLKEWVRQNYWQDSHATLLSNWKLYNMTGEKLLLIYKATKDETSPNYFLRNAVNGRLGRSDWPHPKFAEWLFDLYGYDHQNLQNTNDSRIRVHFLVFLLICSLLDQQLKTLK